MGGISGSVWGVGIRGEQGLELIIHDGGAGLCAALRTVFFDAQQQRCLCHKLRNIYQAITLPEELAPRQRRRKKRICKEFHAIYQAKRWDAMLRLGKDAYPLHLGISGPSRSRLHLRHAVNLLAHDHEQRRQRQRYKSE